MMPLVDSGPISPIVIPAVDVVKKAFRGESDNFVGLALALPVTSNLIPRMVL